jgi:DNA-binding CsgD family transcriptional regulator
MADLEMFEQFLSCRTIDELYASTARIIRQMGFDHFLYGVRVHTSLTRPYQFILSGYPKEWYNHYCEAGYQNIDPIVDHFLKKHIPIIWDDSVFKSEAAARLWGEAGEFGLASGASFGVHGRNGEAALLSLATSRKPGPARSDIVAASGIAQLLTCYLHEAIARLVLSKEVIPVERIDLTAREKECLLWAGDGKTSWEIAKILGVSERTITFHVQNASHKLGVSSRQHAIARALSLGLISPCSTTSTTNRARWSSLNQPSNEASSSVGQFLSIEIKGAP